MNNEDESAKGPDNNDELLFREEAVRSHAEGYFGPLSVQASPLGWIALGVCGILAAVSAALLIFGHVTKREFASGVLSPVQALTDVNALSSGVVSKVYAKDGDLVKAGDPLVEVSIDQSSASLGGTKSAIVYQLRDKEDGLKSDIAQSNSALAVEFRTLTSKLTNQIREGESIRQQIKIEEERAEDANRMYQAWLKVQDSGAVSEAQIIQEHDVLLQHRGQLAQLQREKEELDAATNQVKSELAAFPSTGKLRIHAIQRALNDVEKDISEAELGRAMVIRAPISGTATNVVAHVGQPASPQTFLLSLLPTNTKLEADLLLPSSSIGFVSKGQSVLIKYIAFPYQRFGLFRGEVETVGDVPLSSAEATRIAGRTIAEPRYLVRATIRKDSVVANGSTHQLRPGMELQAEIVVDRQSIRAWLLEPLTALGAK